MRTNNYIRPHVKVIHIGFSCFYSSSYDQIPIGNSKADSYDTKEELLHDEGDSRLWHNIWE